jgi:hypothetical protein
LTERGYFVVPPKVEVASQAWHNENNIIRLFLDTCLTEGGMTFTQTDVHRLYIRWCKEHSLGAVSLPAFTRATWDVEPYYAGAGRHERHQGTLHGYKVLRGVRFIPSGMAANTTGHGIYARPTSTQSTWKRAPTGGPAPRRIKPSSSGLG